MPIPRPLICVILLALSLSAPVLGQTDQAPPPQKIPVPDAAALKDASKLVNEIYSDDLAKAKSIDQKQALAKAMIDAAAQEKNPARNHALLTKAMEIACDAGDMDLASNAIDKLDAVFWYGALQARADAAKVIAKNARQPGQLHKLAVQACRIIDAAVIADRYDLADSLSEIALTSARASGDAGLQRETTAKVQQVHETEVAYAEVKKNYWLCLPKSPPIRTPI